MSYTTQYFFIKKGYIRTARFKTWEIKTFIICEKNEAKFKYWSLGPECHWDSSVTSTRFLPPSLPPPPQQQIMYAKNMLSGIGLLCRGLNKGKLPLC